MGVIEVCRAGNVGSKGILDNRFISKTTTSIRRVVFPAPSFGECIGCQVLSLLNGFGSSSLGKPRV